MTAVVSACELAIGPPGRTLFRIPQLSLAAGEVVALLGPNGSGKTTLLRVLAGLRPPLAGAVELLGRPLSDYTPGDLARRRAVVFAGRIDVPEGTVAEHVALGRHPHTDWLGTLGPRDAAAIAAALVATGLSEFRDRTLATLSDGERQKAALARALAQQPQLLLLDEPTAFLDARWRRELTWQLRDAARRDGVALVFSTHDVRLAAAVADRLWIIDPHAGWRDGPALELLLAGALAFVDGAAAGGANL